MSYSSSFPLCWWEISESPRKKVAGKSRLSEWSSSMLAKLFLPLKFEIVLQRRKNDGNFWSQSSFWCRVGWSIKYEDQSRGGITKLQHVEFSHCIQQLFSPNSQHVPCIRKKHGTTPTVRTGIWSSIFEVEVTKVEHIDILPVLSPSFPKHFPQLSSSGK